MCRDFCGVLCLFCDSWGVFYEIFCPLNTTLFEQYSNFADMLDTSVITPKLHSSDDCYHHHHNHDASHLLLTVLSLENRRLPSF